MTDSTLPSAPADDGQWALTPQDHAVVHVQQALKAHRRGLKVGVAAAAAEVAVVGACAAMGLLDRQTWAVGITFGLTMMAAIPLGHFFEAQPLLESLGPDGPDVGKVRAFLKRRLRSQNLATAFQALCLAGFCGAAVTLGPEWWLMSAVSAAGIYLSCVVDRRKALAQLRLLGEPQDR
jgi:hypothetical protein